ncbi:MAG: M81 family metallopeptidase [Alphaproteobacteria bacterium]|nr:M81 family metallopeptidase [Alphaproteobacteria bacterium]
MRIAVGSLMQETNTFVAFKTTVDTFKAFYLRRGDELLTGYGAARVEVPAFFSVFREAGVEAVPLIAGHAGASGVVLRRDFDELLGDMLERLRKAGPVDGVALALHGAMVVEDEPDAEAEIVRRVRGVVGPGVPIGVSLDLHGHITAAMIQPDVFYIGYREYPHVDMWETGERVARLLLEAIAGRRRPVMALAKRHMIVSPIKATTRQEPLSRIVAEGRRREAAGECLHASLFPVQPWLDVPDLGFAAFVCADGDAAAAQRVAEDLAELAWQARDEFEPELVPLDEAIRTGLRGEGTTVVSDNGDSPSGGAAGDSAAVLAALLRLGADKSGRLTYLTLCDGAAVKAAVQAGPGSRIRLALGHRVSTADGKPVTVEATVRSLSDGVFTMYDAGAEGSVVELGPSAVLAIGDIRIALRTNPAFEWDTGLFNAFGLELKRAALVFVKSPQHFRVAFAPHAARILVADTPGPTCGNMRRLVLKSVTRPLYPIDWNEAHPART